MLHFIAFAVKPVMVHQACVRSGFTTLLPAIRFLLFCSRSQNNNPPITFPAVDSFVSFKAGPTDANQQHP
jgi:hypothetical protein